MRLILELNHPAHVHLFRHAFEALRARGDEVLVVARDKDVALRLLDAFGIPYTILAPIGRSRLGLARELLLREARLFQLARSFRPRVILGTSAHAARIGRLVGAASIVLNEDDRAAVPLFAWVAYPFATAIVTPDCLAHERLGAGHLTYPAFHELFYLHPNRFTPDPSVRAELGLVDGEAFGIVRLSALAAHHDVGKRGATEELIRRVIEVVAPRRLFVSAEKALPSGLTPLRLPLGPERALHALAFADFLIGDSQTMTAEAALLGTPALRISDFVGRLSYLAELESAGLAFGFRPGDDDAVVSSLSEILAMGDRRAVFAERRAALLARKIDPLPWLIATIDRLGQGAA